MSLSPCHTGVSSGASLERRPGLTTAFMAVSASGASHAVEGAANVPMRNANPFDAVIRPAVAPYVPMGRAGAGAATVGVLQFADMGEGANGVRTAAER